jgi:prepilin-type N-terminal cleavage/methylation domain-containing protein
LSSDWLAVKGYRRRGFTLIEVLVAFSIFSALGLIVALSIRAYASNQLKGNLGTDVDRALSVTAGRLETLLRGCRVVTPAVGDTSLTLEFQAPEMDENGLLVVTASGAPVWQTPRQVALVDEKCVISGDDPVVVGNLGPKGALVFERREARILAVSLTAGWLAAESVERSSAKLNIVLSTTP